MRLDKLTWKPGGNSLRVTYFWATDWLCSHCLVSVHQNSSIIVFDDPRFAVGEAGGVTWRTLTGKDQDYGDVPPGEVKTCCMCDAELVANGDEPWGHQLTFRIDTRPKPPTQV